MQPPTTTIGIWNGRSSQVYAKISGAAWYDEMTFIGNFDVAATHAGSVYKGEDKPIVPITGARVLHAPYFLESRAGFFHGTIGNRNVGDKDGVGAADCSGAVSCSGSG